ncbi:hypothetical protein ACLK10_23040 [Escherichia coli]
MGNGGSPNTLCAFKRHDDANTPLAQVMPEVVEDILTITRTRGFTIGRHDVCLAENNPGDGSNEAYSRPADGGNHPA